MIDYYLNGAFMTYGMEVLKFAFTDADERNDPMIKVFPRMTKCTFNKYGPSGSQQNHDALCILALNNVNEKIYIFVWYVNQISRNFHWSYISAYEELYRMIEIIEKKSQFGVIFGKIKRLGFLLIQEK